MKSHKLAQLLLTLPDLDVSTHAMGNTYQSNYHRRSHGPLRVATMNMGVYQKVGEKWVKGKLTSIVIGDFAGVGQWPFNHGSETLVEVLHEDS